MLLLTPPQSKQSSSYSDRDTTEDDSESLEDMDFLSRQKKLQAEAKLALAMAKPMAKMQVEVEKQNRKKSPVADLVSSTGTVITGCGLGHLTKEGWVASFSRRFLSSQPSRGTGSQEPLGESPDGLICCLLWSEGGKRASTVGIKPTTSSP